MLKQYPLLRCLALYRYMPWHFVLTFSLFVLLNISLAWQQSLIGRAVNDAEQGHVVAVQADGSLDYSLAWYWLGVLLGVALLRGVCQYLASLMSLIIGQRLLSLLRNRIMEQVQRLDLAWHWRHGVGEIVTRTTRDSDKLRDALINFWRQVVETSLVAIVTVGMLSWYNPWLGLVPLLLVLTSLGIFMRQSNQLVQLDRAVGDAYDKVTQDLSEGVNGVRVIKAFALEQSRIQSFNERVTDYTVKARAAIRYAAARIPLPQFVVAVGHVWVVGVGAWLVAQGSLNVGQLVAAVLLANTLVFRIEGVGRVMQIFADARSSAARIWEILDAHPAIEAGAQRLPLTPLGLKLDHVSLAAPGGGNDILRDCSLSVAPGEVVALVGTTGSGKSSLMGLLPRLLEAEKGNVSIGSDATGWQDVRALDLQSLRQRVHVVPQESFLFSDTLAANLRVARPDATDAELHEALRLASADDILTRLPQGFDTVLGDKGVTLSGGQRQRLCLARAFLTGASILALDDATSALDAATERRIISNLRELKQRADGRAITVFIVSSKLSTILLADRVLLLAEGRIAANGSHAHLVQNHTAYRELMGIDAPAAVTAPVREIA